MGFALHWQKGISTPHMPNSTSVGLAHIHCVAHVSRPNHLSLPWYEQDKEGDDPSRVGAATNPLMDNGGLSTSIAKMPGGAVGQPLVQP
jgi:hypothetical protein